MNGGCGQWRDDISPSYPRNQAAYPFIFLFDLYISLHFFLLAERVHFLRRASISFVPPRSWITVDPYLLDMLFNSIFLAFLPALVFAANDWSKPCATGTCSYESGDGTNTAWSNLVIVRSFCGSLILVFQHLIITSLECRVYRCSE